MWRWPLALFLLVSAAAASRTYVCQDSKCTKASTDNPSEAISLQECKLTCLPYGGLWPAPTGKAHLASTLVTVNAQDVTFTTSQGLSAETQTAVKGAQDVFLSRVKAIGLETTDDTHRLAVKLTITDPTTSYLTTGADESYALTASSQVNGDEKTATAEITAPTFLGARHGLETLAQLIVYDDLHKRQRMPSAALITDKPVFPHRGVSIDTARSYFPPAAILGIIDAMAQNKLNSLHWHITDTHSFPYVSNAYPVMSADGAYSADKVYRQADIAGIVEYARVRGVRVTPELDAPAHVGEGWAALDPDLITCFRWEPWTKYCVEPPCGQFNPIKDRLYDVLHTIYQEWAQLFRSDLFHMGGDEVNLNCWNSTESITSWMTANNISLTEDGLHQLWDIYQKRSLEQLKNANPKATPVLWTSTLTENGRAPTVLDPSEYIIQIWTTRSDKNIATLIDQKYRLIFSNYDELYFDCGGGAWIGGPGQNWCSPYVGWQSVYGHDPLTLLTGLNVTITEQVQAQVLGSEAALWTEQVDEQQVAGRLWPRGAALAERLWSRPSTPWTDAQYRMNYHRERMVGNGVRAELLQPAWCYHNDGFCGLGV